MHENKLLLTDFTINCKGKLIDLSTPIIMGIVNTSPNSFYSVKEDAITLANKMLQDGATIIDIGGMSSKPGTTAISEKEELERTIPIIEKLVHAYNNIVISIDTYRSTVAKKAIEAGACIVNDISAGALDTKMLETVATLKAPYIAMHMQGTPDTMQKNPTYENVVQEVLDFFIHKIVACKNAGINDTLIDVGFGFGKSIEHNFSLLKNLHCFKILERPILAGISRKSMVYKTIASTPENSLSATSALHMQCLLQGAKILRVHDVKEAKECVTLYNQLEGVA